MPRWMRRKWIGHAGLSLIAAAARSPGREETSDQQPQQPLLSPPMLAYLRHQRGGIVIDPIYSSLDEFIVVSDTLPYDGRHCYDFLFAWTDDGLIFNSVYGDVRIKRAVLRCGRWEYVGGEEERYCAAPFADVEQTVARTRQALDAIHAVVGVSDSRRPRVEISGEVMARARAYQDAGILDRERTSPFERAVFQAARL